MSAEKKPLLSPVLKLFMTAMILANISSSMAFGFMSLYLVDLGAGVADVGTVFTVTSLVPLALQIVGGWLSDSIGRLKTVALGSAAGVVGAVGFWLAPTWQWVMFFLGITFIAVSMVSPSFSSFIADQTEEDNRGKVFGITSSLYQVIGVIGPPLGGYLAQNYSYKTMYFWAMILYAGAAVMRFWMAWNVKWSGQQKSEPLSIQSFKTSIKSMVGLLFAGGIVTWIFLADGASDIAFRLTSSIGPLYQEEVGGLTIQQIGLLTSIQSITMMIFNIPGGWLSDKYGERVGISIGFFFFSVAFLTYLPAIVFWRYALAWVIFGIGASLVGPAFQALISRAVPEEMRGTAFGFFESTLGLISLPAPWIGAKLWEIFSPSVPFYITAFSCTLIAGFCWFKLKMPKVEVPVSDLAPEAVG